MPEITPKLPEKFMWDCDDFEGNATLSLYF